MGNVFRFLGVFAIGVVSLLGCGDGDGGGGSGGPGGVGGRGTGGYDVPIECNEVADRCESLPIEPDEPCCPQEVPDQANACDGTESVENPSTCTATGNSVTYRLTFMEIEGDCNVGYDLDGCDGEVCVAGGLAGPEGLDGVDNGLAGLQSLLVGVGGSGLSIVNRAVSDSLCGMTDSRDAGTCDGGDNDGKSCTTADDCLWPAGRCDFNDHDCLREIPPTEIRFVIDVNADENCANVRVLAGQEERAHILNLSDDGCASGALGTIPLLVYEWGVLGALSDTLVRMTVSPEGFSHGRLGVALDANIVGIILEHVFNGDLDASTEQFFDFYAAPPPLTRQPIACNAMSATLRIGGVAEAAP